MLSDDQYHNRLQALQHDLRGPSLTLLRTIQMLRRGTIPPAHQEHFLYQAELLALKNRMRIEALFDEAQSHNDSVDLERINLGQTIEQYIPQLHDIIEIDALYHSSLATTLSFVTPPHPVYINGSTGHIQRILENLVINSVTAGALAVQITLTSHPPQAHLSIMDDGPGFPDEVLNHQRISLYNGSGLGLFGVRSNVILLNGTIQFANTDEGACVTITIPLVD